MQNRLFRVRCVPAQWMSADKLYKRFRPKFRHEKISGLIWIQTVHHQYFKTSTPETTVSNELPIYLEIPFGDQMGLLKTGLLVT